MDKVDLKEFHWMMDLLQSLDVGLVVVDQEFKVQVWNRFMANHSGQRPEHMIDKNLFANFPDIPEAWFRNKLESVFLLKNRAFTTWEQRPYLFRFRNYRPITGMAEFMYQNITLIPLVSSDSEVHHIGIIIYDVTDIAVSKQGLESANELLGVMSQTDMLTQLYNRGHWEDCLQKEFRRFKRTKQECSLVMFDIDHFKKVNDTYGHQAGDEVIRHTANTLLNQIRTTDIAGRYGGEEFGVLLIDTPTEGAKIFCERLREKIESSIVTHAEIDITYTISLGIAVAKEDMPDYKEWLSCTDQALYGAKETGRNRVVIHDELKN